MDRIYELNQFTDNQNAAGQAPLPVTSTPHYLDETNSYSYQNVQRQRQLTLGDLLLENRIVFLQGEIHTGNANEVVMKLLYLQSENRNKDIHFTSIPPVEVSLRPSPFLTQYKSSAARCCHLLCRTGREWLLYYWPAGPKGKRFALPHSRVMMHQPYGGVSGQISDINIQADEILRNREVLNQILATRAANPKRISLKIPIVTFFLTAQQAVEYGVVDDLLRKPAERETQPTKKKRSLNNTQSTPTTENAAMPPIPYVVESNGRDERVV